MTEKFKIDLDDKDLAIVCLTLIAIITSFQNPDIADKVIISVVSAIAGFVTGRKKS